MSLKNGQADWPFEINYPEWGRYMIRACDVSNGLAGHCSAQTFYMDWPGWAGRSQKQAGEGAAAISMESDKERYLVGETAQITLPEIQQGRAWITIESASKVLDSFWLSAKQLRETNNTIKINLTPEMTPNVYVSTMIIQPHSNRKNDLPIRLYGVHPLLVSDPDTQLNPQIEIADELKPLTTNEIKISESSGKEMTYTLAMVDEGLLGITRFKTPDLHRNFYRKEALGIKTWDLFDDLVGGYAGSLENILSIGGDENESAQDGQKKQNRFPPCG